MTEPGRSGAATKFVSYMLDVFSMAVVGSDTPVWWPARESEDALYLHIVVVMWGATDHIQGHYICRGNTKRQMREIITEMKKKKKLEWKK